MHDRHDGAGHEGEKQLAVEARSHLAQQRAAARPGVCDVQRVEQRRAAEQQQVEHAGQHDELGEIDQVAERR